MKSGAGLHKRPAPPLARRYVHAAALEVAKLAPPRRPCGICHGSGIALDRGLSSVCPCRIIDATATLRAMPPETPIWTYVDPDYDAEA